MRVALRYCTAGLMALGMAGFLGCSTAQKTSPHMGFAGVSIQAKLERKDLVILNSVEATSSTTSILGGLIQIVDNDNVKIIGIPFFTDKYTYWSQCPIALLCFIFPITPEDRAYYKALEKHPDADVIFMKSMDRESWGVPILFSTKSVTWRGKAARLRSDR